MTRQEEVCVGFSVDLSLNKEFIIKAMRGSMCGGVFMILKEQRF